MDVAQFRAPKPRYTSNFLETSKNSYFSEPVACPWITVSCREYQDEGSFEGFNLWYANFWLRAPLDKLARQPNSRQLGMLWLVERVEFLCLRDTPQRVAANRPQPLSIYGMGRSDKGFRKQYVAFNRTTHRGYAAYFIDGRANHCKVHSLEAADIAVKDLANMQAKIDLRDGPSGPGAA